MRTIALFLCCFCASWAGVTTVTLEPDNGADLWLSSTYEYPGPGATRDHWGVNDEKLQAGGWGDEYRILLAFPVDSKARIANSAKVRLHSFDRREFANDGGVPTPMIVCLITSGWDENVTGWHTQPTYEYLGMVDAPNVNSWFEVDITSTYNEWVEGSRPNFGIALFPVLHGVAGQYPNFSVFRSSEYSDPQFRPQLVVSGEVSTPVPSGHVPVGKGSHVHSWREKISVDVPGLDLQVHVPRWFALWGPPLMLLAFLLTFGARAYSSSH